MGFGGISFGSLLVILAVAALIFGTKRVRHMGEDLGVAFKSFRKAMRDDDTAEKIPPSTSDK